VQKTSWYGLEAAATCGVVATYLQSVKTQSGAEFSLSPGRESPKAKWMMETGNGKEKKKEINMKIK